MLLEKGANVNTHNSNGYTPLIVACQKDNAGIVDMLIGKGVDVNISNKNIIPLIIACQKNNSEIVRMLLGKGANVNIMDYKSLTPLHIACIGKSMKIIEMLLENGADVNKHGFRGITPFFIFLDFMWKAEKKIDEERYDSIVSRFKLVKQYIINKNIDRKYTSYYLTQTKNFQIYYNIVKNDKKFFTDDLDNKTIDNIKNLLSCDNFTYDNYLAVKSEFPENDKCSSGTDYIEYKTYENFGGPIKGIILPDKTILCIDLQQELNVLNGDTFKYKGCVVPKLADIEIITNRKTDADNNRYLWHFIDERVRSFYFFVENFFVLLTDCDLFELVEIDYKWYDVNSGVSVYHNDDHGDQMYLLLPKKRPIVEKSVNLKRSANNDNSKQSKKPRL
jgi:hypothetical protein